MDKGAERMVASLDGQEQLGVTSLQPFGVISGERAVGVDFMHHGPSQWKQGNARVRQGEIVHAAERMTFRVVLVQEQAELSRGMGEQRQPPIGDPHHQGRRAVMRGDDNLIGEQDFWPRL